jgi:hypothetical protein
MFGGVGHKLSESDIVRWRVSHWRKLQSQAEAQQEALASSNVYTGDNHFSATK